MLRGSRVILRPIEQKDHGVIVAWRNSPHVMAGLFSYRPLTLQEHERWFAAYLEKRDEMLFVIEEEDGTPIGTVGLNAIDFRNQSAEYGRMLIGDQAYLGKGYAAEATLVLLDYAFDELHLHRVFLWALADNESALKLYERCHFKVEGCCRDAHFSGGRFHDVLLMAVLDTEYRQFK